MRVCDSFSSELRAIVASGEIRYDSVTRRAKVSQVNFVRDSESRATADRWRREYLSRRGSCAGGYVTSAVHHFVRVCRGLCCARPQVLTSRVICVNVRVQRGSRGRRTTEVTTRRDDSAPRVSHVCGDDWPREGGRRLTLSVLGESSLFLNPQFYHTTCVVAMPIVSLAMNSRLAPRNCHVSRRSRFE